MHYKVLCYYRAMNLKDKITPWMIMMVIFGLYLGWCAVDHKEESESIAILGLHDIVRDEVKDSEARFSMWIASESSLRKQLAYLKEQGYKTWSLDDLNAWYEGEKEIDGKVVVLTFDDGYASSATLIEPLLREYGFQGATFVIGSMVEDQKPADASLQRFVSKEDMTSSANMQYYSHTYQLHDKNAGQFAIDRKSKADLQADFDVQKQIVDCSYVAYPYGHANALMTEVLKENDVKLAFGYHENRKATRKDDRYQLPRFSVNAYTSMDMFRTMLESK